MERRGPALQGLAHGRAITLRIDLRNPSRKVRARTRPTPGRFGYLRLSNVEGGVGASAALQVAEEGESADRVRDTDAALSDNQPAHAVESRSRRRLADCFQAVGERHQVADHLHPAGQG